MRSNLKNHYFCFDLQGHLLPMLDLIRYLKSNKIAYLYSSMTILMPTDNLLTSFTEVIFLVERR